MAKSKPTPPAVARAERAVVRAAEARFSAKDIEVYLRADDRLWIAVKRLQAARKKGARG